jgi:hypothetical protein
LRALIESLVTSFTRVNRQGFSSFSIQMQIKLRLSKD